MVILSQNNSIIRDNVAKQASGPCSLISQWIRCTRCFIERCNFHHKPPWICICKHVHVGVYHWVPLNSESPAAQVPHFAGHTTYDWTKTYIEVDGPQFVWLCLPSHYNNEATIIDVLQTQGTFFPKSNWETWKSSPVRNLRLCSSTQTKKILFTNLLLKLVFFFSPI